jgi:lantibiotic modifying enzyme
VTGRRDMADLARAALRPLCGSLAELGPRLARGTYDAGLGTGAASCAYGLLRAAAWLDDADLLAASRRWADLLDPAALPATSDDLIAGRAGALLLLVRLHAATGEGELLARASRFADDLLARRQVDATTGLRVWRGRGRAEAGLAHGQSGIAYALAELAAAAGRSDARQAALEALAHERQVLGPDLAGTALDEVYAAWSHGATGIGLARAGVLRTGDDPALRQDLAAAVERAREHLLEGSDDLGTGILGRVELLAAAAAPLARPALLEQARQTAGVLLARATRDGRYRLGWHGGYQHPGLHQGLAGIALTWARWSDSDRAGGSEPARGAALWA